MITDLDLLAFLCILLAIAASVLAIYAWQEHDQALYQRRQAEEQTMWADHFQQLAEHTAAELATLRHRLAQRQRTGQPPLATRPSQLPLHTVRPDQFHLN